MLFRYPGGKSKLTHQIVPSINRLLEEYGGRCQYREPFFGTGAIGFNVIQGGAKDIWINDLDPSVRAVWVTVAQRPGDLKELLHAFTPNVEAFYEFKNDLITLRDGNIEDPTYLAFVKIACHQMSYSGLGPMAGGPIGGHGQKGRNRIDSRYSLQRLGAKIDRLSALLNSVQTHGNVCTCLDFEKVIKAPGDAVIYLDPPYFEKGNQLYQVGFGNADHKRLAAILKREKRPWLLSYDVNSEILDLYSGWAYMRQVGMTCTINGPNPKNELLISNRPFETEQLLPMVGEFSAMTSLSPSLPHLSVV